MPPSRHNRIRALRSRAPVFAALGDHTRLTLISRLSSGTPLSISRLSHGAAISRQAVTKHLQVLQHAGLVDRVRRGREVLFGLRPDALKGARQTLDAIAGQWDDALDRLRAYVETDDR